MSDDLYRTGDAGSYRAADTGYTGSADTGYTSSDDPDVIRANIESTRQSLSSDVDALADKVTPSKIVERQADKVKNRFGDIKDRVMGKASGAKDRRSEEHTSELQSRQYLVCRLLLEKKKTRSTSTSSRPP